MKYEFNIFFKFHTFMLVILLLCRIYKVYYDEHGTGDFRYLIKSAKLAIVSIQIIIFSFLINKMDFKIFRLFFVLIIALANYNTIFEKFEKEVDPHAMTHSMEIISAATIYCGLYAPVSWKYIFGIMASAQAYYFISMYFLYGSHKTPVAVVL